MSRDATRWFETEHLPPHLAEVVEPFRELVARLDAEIPDGGEQLALAITLLTMAKDAAVRAKIQSGV